MGYLAIFSSFTGLIGGILGIITFIKVKREKDEAKNKLVFYENIKVSYIECFEDQECYKYENINLYFTYHLSTNIVKFKKRGNKFQTRELNFLFERIYAWALQIENSKSNWHGLLFQDDKKISDEILHDFEKNKILFKGLKSDYANFHRSLVGYI